MLYIYTIFKLTIVRSLYKIIMFGASKRRAAKSCLGPASLSTDFCVIHSKGNISHVHTIFSISKC